MGHQERAARHRGVLTASPDSYNRRIGRRVRVSSGATLTWLPLRKRGRFQRAPKPQSATVVDLSITGAMVRAAADKGVVRGTHVEIAIGALCGMVTVRRIDADAEPGWARFGVQFVHLDPALQDLIGQTVTERHPTDAEWRWVSLPRT